MNAVIALCHFCETHGPRILFCTQPFHAQDPPRLESPDTDVLDCGDLSLGSSEGGSARNSSFLARSVSADYSSPNPFQKTGDLCEACRSLPADVPGFISDDREARVSYVSSQNPHHEEVFSMVRQACIRSLSCEVCQGREGPVFFGDNSCGHVLSYTFFLKDAQARGLQRWYSVIVVMMDKTYLLNSCPFLVRHVRRIVEDLQARALRTFERENERCPTRALRLGASAATLPANFRLQRGVAAARSLPCLTGDADTFRWLHSSFTWVLRAGSRRLTETLLEGPPTEDTIVDLESQEEETEEGFVVVHSKKADRTPAQLPTGGCSEDERGPQWPVFDNLRELYVIMGYDSFHQLAHHVVIGDQIVVQCNDKLVAASIIDSLKVLLPRGCSNIIYYSTTYEDSWKCNLLAVPQSTQLPHQLLADEDGHCAVLTVLLPDAPPAPVPKQGSAKCNATEKLAGYRVGLMSAARLPAKGPSVLAKMERAITNQNLTWTVVEQFLVCIKEEWINKVKVLFTFTKAGGNRSELETRKLLLTCGAGEEDQQALKYWMNGLSLQYRNHMLAAASIGHLNLLPT